MSKPYRVLVVGMGKRGNHHAMAFHANKRFEVVGICDIFPDRLPELAAKLGNPKYGTDARALALETNPDIFCFCTLPNLRYELIEVAVQSGASLIAYEKPMAGSMSEALKIMKLIREAGVKTVVSHQHRYGVHYQKVKEIIASGDLGRVHTVYGIASGWMLHMLTHLIEYIRWYNDGVDAEWVMGQAAGKGKFKDNHSSPDYIAGFIHFANGVRGIVDCGAGAPDVPEVDYWWRKCRVGAQGTHGFAEVLTGGGWRAVTKKGAFEGKGTMSYDDDMPPYVAEMADWLDDPKKVHCCNGESAFKGWEIAMGLCRSVIERGQITMPLDAGTYSEIPELEKILPNRPVVPSTASNAKEYLGK